MGMPQFILASASPARRRLLHLVGIEPTVQPSDFDELLVQSSDPALLVETLSLRKADTIAAQIARTIAQPTLIMGCDSVLAINGEIHGKPADADAAIARWQQMRGQIGYLYTGHTLIELRPGQPNADRTATTTANNRTLVRHQVTQVHFANVSDRQIAAYVATGEPLQCAGCFALEGKGGLFIEKLVGCHSNVIGLSLPLLRQMLGELNYDVSDFWAAG